MKTFLGNTTRVNYSVCTCPSTRYKLLYGCLPAIGLWSCNGTLRTRAVNVCVGNAVLASLGMNILWCLAMHG